MPAEEQFRCFIHFIHVRFLFHLPHIVACKRIRFRREADPVFVFFPAGIFTCIKTGPRFFCTQHPYILRQDAVQSPRHVRRWNRSLCRKGNHLAAGMHSRICPAASGNGYGFAANTRQFFFQFLLYGFFFRLPLETGVIASVVADSKFNRSFHSAS